ncbi:hypothetical protein [Rhodonellum sp.]|uniref:hypothetical protein n=1 Tax=Rhodonellum sp. TaxID=2231180 RepID=UPI00272425B4|nr:hypothetical protein [Rhodonellum sp.]MDO9554793.1 hypothetical protein [Rhodonellum sp.]
MENIKLVIWDLDETFWQGTLSKEGVSPIEKKHIWSKPSPKEGFSTALFPKTIMSKPKKNWLNLGFGIISFSPPSNGNQKESLSKM